MARKRHTPSKQSILAEKKTKQQRIIALIVVAITFAIFAILIASNSGEASPTINSLPADITTAMGYQKSQHCYYKYGNSLKQLIQLYYRLPHN